MSKNPLGNDPFAALLENTEDEQSTKTKAKSPNAHKKASPPKGADKDEKTKADTKKLTASKPNPAPKDTKKKTLPKEKTPSKKAIQEPPAAEPVGKPNTKRKAPSPKATPTPDVRDSVPKAVTKTSPAPLPVSSTDESPFAPPPPSKQDEPATDLVPMVVYAEAMRDVDMELPRYDPSLSGDAESNRRLRPADQGLGETFGYNETQSKTLNALIQFLYRFYWRVEVEGVENIPSQGRALLVGNHSGILPYDSLIVRHAVQMEHPDKRSVWPLIEDFIYYAPVLGTMMSKAGAIRACQENAQRLLKEDELVLVFPEGIKGIEKPNAKRYQLQRFGRGGYIKLCLMTDAPVIPVAIVGSEDVHPVVSNLRLLAKSFNLPYFPITPTWPLLGPLGVLPLPAKWRIRFGEPIYVNQFDPDTANDRVAVQRLSNQIRETIQRMLKSMTGKQKSRWF